MPPLAGACKNCRIKRRGCRYGRNDRICQRCTELGQQGCDIAQKLASSGLQDDQPPPQSTAQVPGAQLLQSTLAMLSQPSQPADLEWQKLVLGDYIIIMGVDVGTSNCAICWQLIPKDQILTPDYRLTIQQVEDTSGNQSRSQIPTQAAIIPGEGSHGPVLIFAQGDISNHLGESIEQGDVFRLLKLTLVSADSQVDEKQKRLIQAAQQYNNDIVERYKQSGNLPEGVTDVLDIFQAFLTYLWSVIRASITKRAPSTVSKEVLDSVLKDHSRIVVAVPEIWTATENNHFRRLLLKAGFPNAHIRSEPKLAAAALVQEKQQGRGPVNTQAEQAEVSESLRKSARVIVDIGGGTTDLSCIQVLQIWGKLKFRTILPGVGSMSGSELLNSIFKQKLADILSSNIGDLSRKLGMTTEEVLTSFVAGFEDAKRGFSREVSESHGTVKIKWCPIRPETAVLPVVPALPCLGKTFIRVDTAKVQEVFNEYLVEIKRLMMKQLQMLDDDTTDIRGYGIAQIVIVLVGGGSLISYIQEELREEYTGMGLEFTHHQESNCSLVAKGAALAAIDPDLGLREFARTTYGTILTVPYNAKKPTHVADKHLREETPAWTRHGYELHDRFIPMLKKGQRVNGSYVMDEIIEGEATPGQPFPRVLKHHIYQVDDEEWGQREDWNQWLYRYTDIHVFDIVMETPANVKFVTTLKVQVPQERCEFQTYKVHGVKYYRIWFRAKLVWDGLCEKWLFYVHPTGKQIRTAQDEQECFSADPLVLDDVLARQDMENYDDDDDDHYQARDGLDRIAQAVNGIKSEEDNDLVTGDAMNGVTHQ